MEITGILVKQTSLKEGVSKTNGNPWKIAEYLVEVPGQYTRHTVFRVSDGTVGRVARFDGLVGKMVTVSFEIDAHEYEGRWFNEISAWGVMEYIDQTTRQANMAAAQTQQPSAAQTQQSGTAGTGTAAPQPTESKDGDDLPF